MLISQADIARLPDAAIRRMVLRLREGCEPGAPLDPQHFPTRLAAALVRALNERRRLLALVELDLLNDPEAEGSLGLFTYPPFYEAAGTVVLLSLLAWGISVVLGLLVALGRQSRFRPLARLLDVYVWFFRSLPLLVLLIFVYNAPQVIPELRTVVGSPFVAGLTALVLSETAYLAEIHRGGILSVARGQGEAARALGIPWRGVQQHIIVPQAFRVALPALTNELVTIVKLTSLVSVISLTELLLVGQRLYTQNFKVLETLLVVAIFYVALVSVFDGLLRLLERRLDVTRRRTRGSAKSSCESEGDQR